MFFTGNKEEELDSDDLDDDANEDSDEEQEEGTSSGTETLNGLRRYMERMDEELMGTKVGQSFNGAVSMFKLRNSSVSWCPEPPSSTYVCSD